MGTFTVVIAFGNIDGGDLREVEVLVDTGATHTVLPDEMLRQMSIDPKDTRTINFANGESETWPIGEARIAYAGREWPCPVLFSPHDQRLLGATTLETFSLRVDPANQELITSPLRGRMA